MTVKLFDSELKVMDVLWREGMSLLNILLRFSVRRWDGM